MNSLFENSTSQVEILNFQTFTTEYVAKRYGTSETNIRDHKREHADEIVEGIHFIVETNKFRKTAIKWTLRGIIKLGMFIRSKEAKYFRLWAEHELEKASNLRPSDPIYAQIKAERDYYKERYKKLSQSKDETIILNLAKIQKELEKSYTAIGAVMAYADGDDYFIKKG